MLEHTELSKLVWNDGQKQSPRHGEEVIVRFGEGFYVTRFDGVDKLYRLQMDSGTYFNPDLVPVWWAEYR